ncbi:Prepilin-type cleavage/methylation-like protein [Shewanella sp. ANA-3]|uniref:PilW family protein n=1 Tax=Shewanella sp. (strain ANA-3) TaxID=94122 RepID=UPI00005DE447|nr:PilW family protein [Shewanella sp. ANA-3]ABK49355.1 Prepilin-type cleavage/methylation-like protein [Shewanella sp. ANA-3]
MKKSFRMKLSKTMERGMSLVELMVAMVIGLFLTAGVFTMFSMSSSNVTTTSQFNQLQENGRIALAIMERDISQLGFMGDLTGTDFIVGTNTNIEVTTITADCVGDGLNNATLPNNQPAHFRRLWGYENTATSTHLSCLGNSDVNADTDVLQLKRFIGPNVAAGNSSSVYVAANSSQAVFFVGAPTTALENPRTWEYQHHVYFIANDANQIPILRRKTLTSTGMSNDEQLVEGIENIRFLYGFDNDGDSTPDSFMPAEDVTSLMWDNEGFQRLVAIKAFVLVRSINEDKSYTNETEYLLGDKTITIPANDHYRRKVLSTTIVLENPVLIRS